MHSKISYGGLFCEWNTNVFHTLQEALEHGHVLNELKPEKSDRILEIGCNSGRFTRKLSECCKEVLGIDLNRAAIKKSGLDNLICMNAESLDFSSGSFDKIVSLHTVEHIPDLKKALFEMCRVTKNGGRIVLVFPMEPIRGFAALPSACIVYKNPLMCRKLHLHRLNPEKIKKFVMGLMLKMVSKKVIFSPLPAHLVVLEKKAAI